ncbi:hypothetical protein MUN78_07050 [Leucobacter allii]|uniref:Uncharacterized protein n=1 Tax=Leucobacter allii TaxID=2932247 RepID=A0ABY4FQW4_9MICO|nr:hypothetical protein [Leucobacter allii]UOQ58574.1 hypothetical protein MUN78_07050 [Leucobacter allii]
MDATSVERIVGRRRHPTLHFGRAVSAEERVYVLHSEECRSSTPDLRDCEYSIAQDRGIDAFYPWLFWSTRQDRAVELRVKRGWLIPMHAVAELTPEERRDPLAAYRRHGLGVWPQLLENEGEQ